MSIKTIIYDPKTLKGKEKSNHVLITVENAEWRGKTVPFFYFPRFSRFPWFIGVLNTNSSLIQIQNLIYDKLWNRCTSDKTLYLAGCIHDGHTVRGQDRHDHLE